MPLTTTDVDNGLTNATEYDALGRPVKQITAQGSALESWTRTEYDDLNRRVVVRSDLETKGDGKKVAAQFYDQLGRVRLSKTLEDAAVQSAVNETDGIKVQTRYAYHTPTDPANSNGTYSLTSNPYRAATSTLAGSEPTMGWTLSYGSKTGKHSETTSFSGAGLPAPWGANTATTGTVATDVDADRTLVTDQAGKQRISKTNVLGQLSEVWEIKEQDSATSSVTFPNTGIAYGYQTIYTYDSLGNMVKVAQGSQSRYFMYSSLNRLLKVRQPEQEVNPNLNTFNNPQNNYWTTGFTYDYNGNVLTSTDARGKTVTSTYDEMNRVTHKSYSDSTPAISYTYDDLQYGKGKLSGVSNSVSSEKLTSLDNLGNPLTYQQTTDGVIYNSSYRYNLSGILLEETYPSGRKVKNVLSQNGYLSLIQSKKTANTGYSTYASSISYTSSGKIERLQLGNNRWESAKLNSRNQITELALGIVNTDNSLWKINYEYGEYQSNGTVNTAKNSGDVAKQTISFSGQAHPYLQAYKYDALSRIIEAKETVNGQQKWSQNYGYDRYGNRTNLNQLVGTQQVSQSPAFDVYTNRFQSETGIVYDAAGNIVRDADGRQFTFNGENKQTQVKDASNNIIGLYYYDGNGRRIKKVTSIETTIFVYDAVGKLIAEQSTQLAANPTVSYTATDSLETPRAITDANGNIISRRDFMPFGEEISAGVGDRTENARYGFGSDNVRQRFTGYQKDQETGLDFAEARYYNNKHGRFTAVDPLLASGQSANPQTFNRYAYVMNRPLAFTDPTGLQAGRTSEEQPPPTPQERQANRQAVAQANQAAGTFSPRETERFNTAQNDSVRMVAVPMCRDALRTNFGPADPAAALQGLVATGGEFALDRNDNIIPGNQNVFNGSNTLAQVNPPDGPPITVTQYFNNNREVSAIHDTGSGAIYLDDSFFSGRGDVGRAQDLIHETVVHKANGRRDAEFALPVPEGQVDTRTPAQLMAEGSRRINAIIQANCGTIPQNR